MKFWLSATALTVALILLTPGGPRAGSSTNAGPTAGEASAMAGHSATGSATQSSPATAPAPTPRSAPSRVDEWPQDEVVRATALCTQMLSTVEAVVMPLDPIKDGECGTPAPFLLLTLGRNPEVVLSPPPTLTCGMVSVLADWLEHDLQPLARKHLGGPITKIETMSSYSCRNAYGRRLTRLSEHGRANALDIRNFSTGTVEAALLEDWGLTAREIHAQIAAAAKAAAEAVAKTQAAPLQHEQAGAGAVAQTTPAPILSYVPPAAAASPSAAFFGQRLDTFVEGLPAPAFQGGARPSPAGTSLGFTGPSRLNGPKSRDVPVKRPDMADRKAQFLREAHRTACARFGTVLGPEANEAHRNHLHVDQAVRATSSFCE